MLTEARVPSEPDLEVGAESLYSSDSSNPHSHKLETVVGYQSPKIICS